jgi:hypothetical protein
LYFSNYYNNVNKITSTSLCYQEFSTRMCEGTPAFRPLSVDKNLIRIVVTFLDEER